jgi:hypothetical protein
MNEDIIAQKILYKRAERPGREIRLDHKTTGNPNVSIKIGTVDDKNRPSTVYVNATFWVGLKGKERSEDFGRRISREYSKELFSIYRNRLKYALSESKYFPFFNDNIYVSDFPENIAYNHKRCFTSIELSLHTINCLSSRNKDYPLKTSGDTELYDELLKIANIIASSELLLGKKSFTIHKRKK